MHIDDYSFGRIVIGLRAYTSDVIVYPDRVEASWWRKEGHCLHPEDLVAVVAARPELVIIGTGDSGMMEVPERTKAFLEAERITVLIERTGRAVHLFNEQRGRNIIGAFHLTC
ncbi:MAG TPA: MTH938/NDUFAF3 family protein [Thermodesulfovibrionales bacterium]|nr:MTH938/NDUFAF3 family protein [Thermodesulfovibrionales bacterium]